MLTDPKKQPDKNIKDRFFELFGKAEPGKKNQNALPPKTHFSIWYFIIVFFLVTYLQQFIFAPKTEIIPYSSFKQSLVDGNVKEVTLDPVNISGTLKGNPDKAFSTIRVDDPGLVKELDEQRVSYSGRVENRFFAGLLSWVLPLVFFFSDLAVYN